MMRYIGPIIARLRIGRFRDWYRWTWVKFKMPGRVIAAETPHIDPPFLLRVESGATLRLGRNVHILPGLYLQVGEGGEMEIGDDVIFNIGCYIGSMGRLKIGSGVLFGPGSSVTDGNHEFTNRDVPIWRQGFEVREVTIGNNVWLGAKATVINSIGNDCVIGANAVVTHPIPDNSVAVGIPARVIRTMRDDNDSERADQPEGAGS